MRLKGEICYKAPFQKKCRSVINGKPIPEPDKGYPYPVEVLVYYLLQIFALKLHLRIRVYRKYWRNTIDKRYNTKDVDVKAKDI